MKFQAILALAFLPLLGVQCDPVNDKDLYQMKDFLPYQRPEVVEINASLQKINSEVSNLFTGANGKAVLDRVGDLYYMQTFYKKTKGGVDVTGEPYKSYVGLIVAYYSIQTLITGSAKTAIISGVLAHYSLDAKLQSLASIATAYPTITTGHPTAGATPAMPIAQETGTTTVYVEPTGMGQNSGAGTTAVDCALLTGVLAAIGIIGVLLV